VPILSGRCDMTIRSANRSEDFGLLPCSRGTVERAPDLPALCVGLVRSQMGLSIGTIDWILLVRNQKRTTESFSFGHDFPVARMC
jgi:hypothetical protein